MSLYAEMWHILLIGNIQYELRSAIHPQEWEMTYGLSQQCTFFYLIRGLAESDELFTYFHYKIWFWYVFYWIDVVFFFFLKTFWKHCTPQCEVFKECTILCKIFKDILGETKCVKNYAKKKLFCFGVLVILTHHTVAHKCIHALCV